MPGMEGLVSAPFAFLLGGSGLRFQRRKADWAAYLNLDADGLKEFKQGPD